MEVAKVYGEWEGEMFFFIIIDYDFVCLVVVIIWVIIYIYYFWCFWCFVFLVSCLVEDKEGLLFFVGIGELFFV